VSATPVDIRRVENREIHILWADGHRTVFTNRFLRQTCPCAGCVSELTGERVLRPESVRPDVRAEEISLVGRYAIQIRWSDGHSTGIYSFEKLRAECPCEACRPGGAPERRETPC